MESYSFNAKKPLFFVLISSLALITACGGGGGDSITEVPTPPPIVVSPPPVAQPININITNPVLKIFDNTPVSDRNNMSMVWSEEFDETQLDPETWFFESGDGSQYGLDGWGNNELQWYLEDSATIDNGVLVISAAQEMSNNRNYTSARLHTRDRVAVRYGRIEARMKLPLGQGIWPAFWLMPQSDTYGTWAASGELDIMEAINLGVDDEYKIHGTIHHGAMWPNNTSSTGVTDVTRDSVLEFHNYAVEWDINEIRWYIDDTLYATQTNWSTINAPFPAPFDEPFYIILNLAVGGNWPGSPNSTTVFPQTLEVDYIRVYEGR